MANINIEVIMVRYKVLQNNMESLHKGFQYKLGKEYTCADFDEDIHNGCSNGFYATGIEGILYSFRNNGKYKVFECEVSGRSVEIGKYKMRYEKIKLLREIPIEELKELIKEETKKLDYDLYHIMFPVNPLLLPKVEVTDKHIELLKEWAKIVKSMRHSVGTSVGDSLWESVGKSLWESVRDSVGTPMSDFVLESDGESTRDFVWDSMYGAILAYDSSLFPNVKEWKYIEHEPGINPFQPAIDLWNEGLVPSFDGKTWRLHQGEDAKIVYELK